MDSILTSIKKLLGISSEYEHFDADLIMHINSVFMVLNQLGVGPEEPFSISDEDAIWKDFIQDVTDIESVKSYMHLRVRLLFDPPLNASIISAMERQANEFEWRLYLACDERRRIQNGE